MPSMNDKIGGADQLDIGAIITSPTKDPEWLKKCAIIGLMMLIPIAGALNLSGWMKAIADKHLANAPDKDILPEANLNYMGAGWRFFLAYLPVMGIVFLMMMVAGGVVGLAAATGNNRQMESIVLGIVLLFYGAILLFALGMAVVGPAIMFLHIVDGEPWASIQFRRMFEVIKQGGTQYLLLFVAVLVAGMIGQLGVIACYFGLFVTIPFGQAMVARAIADYAKILKPEAAGFKVDGGTGSSSGTPFGVKL